MTAGNATTVPNGSNTATTVTATSGGIPSYILDRVLNFSPANHLMVTESVSLRSSSGTSFSVQVVVVEAVGSNVTVCSQTYFTLTSAR